MDKIGLQHVLSLSNLAEKIQQEAQHRTDLAQINIVTVEKDKELEQSAANPPAEMVRQTANYQKDSEKKNLKSAVQSKKKISEKETEDTKTEEQTLSSQEGNIIDLFV